MSITVSAATGSSTTGFALANKSLPRDVPAAVNPAVKGSPPVSSAIPAAVSPSTPAVPRVPKSNPSITGAARLFKSPVIAAVKGSPPVAAAVKALVRAGWTAAGAADAMLPANGPNKVPPAADVAAPITRLFSISRALPMSLSFTSSVLISPKVNGSYR